MASPKSLDAHERPPEDIRNIYKKYQKMKKELLALDPDITDISSGDQVDALREVRHIKLQELRPTFRVFNVSSAANDLDDQKSESTIRVYEHPDVPGKEEMPCLATSPGRVRCSSDTAR